jgi:hypothetical protein
LPITDLVLKIGHEWLNTHLDREEDEKGDSLPDVENVQPVLDLLREIFDVLPILRREQHCLDSSSESSNELLLDATDGCDATT